MALRRFPWRDAPAAHGGLLCITRTVDAKGLADVQIAWDLLRIEERDALVQWLLGDGLNHPGYIRTFLPNYFANAKGNTSNIHQAFVVFVMLLEMLRASQCFARTGSRSVSVDLAGLATIVGKVESLRALSASLSTRRLRSSEPRSL